VTVIDLTLTLPGDGHLTAMVQELGAHAARMCGRPAAQAAQFGGTVASAVDAACDGAGSGCRVTCTLRQNDDSLEVVITGAWGSRTLTLD
jgi:hypothetical protein